VDDVENSLKEARRVCKNGGVISIYLPTDPGIMYRFMRKIFTARRASKLRINYEYINALGHRNHFYSII
jgi:ubiquinone/menaquinone biosynthesis C-methylase UbiE